MKWSDDIVYTLCIGQRSTSMSHHNVLQTHPRPLFNPVTDASEIMTLFTADVQVGGVLQPWVPHVLWFPMIWFQYSVTLAGHGIHQLAQICISSADCSELVGKHSSHSLFCWDSDLQMKILMILWNCYVILDGHNLCGADYIHFIFAKRRAFIIVTQIRNTALLYHAASQEVLC